VRREAYGEAGHIFDGHPEISVWAGQRFYRRKDVHITDFFFQDMSAYGAGFQDLGHQMRICLVLCAAFTNGSQLGHHTGLGSRGE